MTWPLEGSREIDEGIIISEAMDWCKSPTAIVPYRLYAYQRDAMNLAYTVKQTSDPTHVKDSIVLKSYGDEPGVGGGVISGTHNAECTPKTWSQSVTAGGRNLVRHDDEWWMNHKNTWGRLTYVKDPNQYPGGVAQSITPVMTNPSSSSTGLQTPSADQYMAFSQNSSSSVPPWGPSKIISTTFGRSTPTKTKPSGRRNIRPSRRMVAESLAHRVAATRSSEVTAR